MKQSILLICIVALLSALPVVGSMPQPPKNPLMAMPQMSEEELVQFQREIDAQIDQFVQSLPEDEQKQFYKDVEELSQVMSTMSEEELMQFMDKVLAEDQVAEQQMPQPAPTIGPKGPAAEVMPAIQVEQKPKPVEVKQPTTTGPQPLFVTIDSILTSIERFMLKAQIIPELTGDIANWIEKATIKELPAQITWAQLKEKIDELVYRLKKLKERDPINTQLYRYLGYVHEPLPLHTNIQRLSTQLNKHEPQVEAPAFGLGKVSKTSRTAIREVISTLADAVYQLSMIEELDKIFKEYGPRELELVKLEEEAHKKAIEASKTKPKPLPTVQIGAGDGTGFVAIPEASHAYEHESYGAPSRYHDYDYDQEAGFDQEPAEHRAPGSATASKRPKSEMTDKERKEQEAKATDGGTAPGKPGTKPKKKDAKEAEDKKADMYLKAIERQLEKVGELLDMPKLYELEKHIRSNEPIDPELVNALRTIAAAYARAHDQAKALVLHLSKAKKNTADHYNDQLIDTVKYYKELHEPLLKQINTVLVDAGKLGVDRRYAYFGDKDLLDKATQKSKDIGTLVPEPVSLQELAETMKQLYDIVAKEEKKKSQVPHRRLPASIRVPVASESEE